MQNQYAPPRAAVADVNRSGSSGVTDTMIEAMRGTKPWVMLIGVVMVILAIFMFLGTVGILIGGAMGMSQAGPEAGALLAVGVMYGLMGVIYLVLGIYLIKYSTAIGRFVQSASVVDMEDSLVSQRKFWKLSGILTLVMIVLMVVGMIAVIAIPALMMGMQ
jgi:Family of unknown function (DUF5362)